MKMVEFTNSVDLDEAFQNESAHLYQHQSLNSQFDIVSTKDFLQSCRFKFCCLHFGA